MGVGVLALEVLPRPESIALLRKHRPELAEDDADLDALANELGDLPLALHLAGSFLETYRDDPLLGHPADLLAELRDTRLLQHPALLGEDVTPSPTNHVLHVGKTFAVSYNRLQPEEPVDAVSVALLARSAWFAAGEPIPRELLLATFPVPPDDRVAARQAAQGLLRLHALGLLEVIDAGALRLHRLLAAFVQGVSDDAASITSSTPRFWGKT